MQNIKGAGNSAPFFVVLGMFSYFSEAVAEVPVVDVVPGMEVVPASEAVSDQEQRPFAVVNSNSADQPELTQLNQLFYQLQSLQQEMQELRGLVEEQNHVIQKLKQQRLDDYVDLDKRIAELREAGTVSSSAPAAMTEPSTGTPESGASEKAHYTRAYNLLKERQVDKAVSAFKQHIAKYPRGEFTANAYYWLGEIYLLQGELTEAEGVFSTVVNSYPASRKIPDAKFKLGKVFFQQGKKEQAKKLISELAAGDTQVAPLAKTYLNTHF